jgi:DNA-binding Xre family transcriptional regulator
MLNLGEILTAYSISQAQLARDVAVSRSALNMLIKTNRYPKQISRRDLRSMICAVLAKKGVAERDLIDAFLEADTQEDCAPGKSPGRENARLAEVTTPRSSAAPSGATTQPLEVESEMLLRKQTLNEAARRKFKYLP